MVETPQTSRTTNTEKEAELVQQLAKELKTAHSAREAYKISRQLAKVSKDLETASRAVDDSEKAMRAAV